MRLAADLDDNLYVRDLLDQPRALRATIGGLELTPALEAVVSGSYDAVVLTGMGSSYHGLHPLNLRLIEHGLRPVMVETSELLHHAPRLLEGRVLLVAVSQSGRSVEIVRLLDREGPRPAAIGVTNSADSPLATKTDAAVVTRAGPESTVACKTYASTLAALDWLGAVLCRQKPNRLVDEVEQTARLAEQYLANWKEHVQVLLPLLEGVRHVFLVGRGASLASAGNGALILKESSHVHAEGMSGASFRHGPIEMMREDVFVLVFSGAPATVALTEKLALDIRGAGWRAALAGESAEPGPFRLPASPILEMLPVQMMSLALATLAGHEPGRFTIGTKVTTIE
jgi:glucosamine--fructose-6-phosphate aminotransferase (isomerizing)